MSDEVEEKDLFGNPVVKKKARTSRATSECQPKQIVSTPRICRARRIGPYLWRLLTEGARNGAVVVIGTALATLVFSGAAWITQMKYDWIGKTRAEIGEWTTTLERTK